MHVVFCYHTTDYEYSLGIAAISASLDAHSIYTSLVTFKEIDSLPNDTVNDTVNKILHKQPDIVAFSIMTFNWDKIQKVINELRPFYSGLIVVGGCHAILRPKEVLCFPGVDAVCPGEGEKPLLDLVNTLRSEGQKSICNVPGMIFKKSPQSNSAQPWCNEHPENFDYLSYRIFDEEENRPLQQKITGPFNFAGVFSLPLLTSRGCPYKCTYCNNHSLMKILGGAKRYLRTFSPGWTVDKICRLTSKYRPDFIEFMDEMFLKDMKWMREFCSLYTHKVGLPFSINVRIDRCSEELVRLLAKSGLKLVFFGLECGDYRYRTDYLNRHMSNEDILAGSRILHKFGIIIITYNMFGMPDETPETMQKTIAMNRKIRPHAIAPFVYQPLPGTRLAQIAHDRGLVQAPPLERWDYLAPSLDSKDLPATLVQEQVNKFRQEFNSQERLAEVASRIRCAAGKEPLPTL